MNSGTPGRPDPEDKRRWRQLCREKTAALSEEERRKADAALLEAVTQLPEYQESQVLLAYVSEPNEPDTRALITDALRRGMTVAAPRCAPAGCTMRFHILTSLRELTPGAYGVSEPPPGAPAVDARRGLLLVPALGYDVKGYRLGHGKGYYDRFLSEFDGFSLGLCYEALLFGTPLPHGPYDLPVDALLTEKRLLRFGSRGSVSAL